MMKINTWILQSRYSFAMYRMVASHIIILALFAIVKPSKILVVVPTPMISHQLVYRSLIQELIKLDHEVTVITTDSVYPQDGSPNNLNEINLHNLSYTLRYKMVNELAKIGNNNLAKLRFAIRMISKIFIEQLKDEKVMNLIRNTTMTYDLVILENCAPASLIFSYIFKAPVIFCSSSGAVPGDMLMLGSGTHPFLYPSQYQHTIYNLNFYEKICGLYTNRELIKLHEEHELDDERMLKDLFGINTPQLNELKKNIHMLFLNIHPLFLHNQPVPLNVVYTSGIYRPLEKTLPKDLESYLNTSKRDVIYFSFGSVFETSNIPPEILEIFSQVFSRLPYNILWKWDSDEIPGKPENVKILKWFPQSDLLGHPKVKLFITHGGLQSTNEAIKAGVPLIGIPQFSDQEYNTEKYVYFKIGIKLNYKSLTIENFENAINTVLTNYDSYKKNIVQLRTQMYDQPRPAVDHVIWWIEYILRHGGVQHLRAPAANMSWVEYYELELVFLILSGMILLGTVLLTTIYTCFLIIQRLITL